MPNTPIQVPNIALPGAEYFSLAPNATVAMGGRRRIAFAAANTTAPATTNSVTNSQTGITLESPFTPTSGIYLHYFFVDIVISAPGLTLGNVNAGLTLNGTAGPTYFLGIPSLTSPTINLQTVLLLDRDRFICQKDVQASDIAAGVGVSSGTLFLSTQLNVNNSTAGAIIFHTSGLIVYTRLDGLTE